MSKFHASILWIGLGFALNSHGITKNELLPSIAMTSSANKSVLKSEELKGKITLINFWATWCEACKVELKEFSEQLPAALKNEKFRFVFVALDKEPEKAEQWVNEQTKDIAGLKPYLYLDPSFAVAETLAIDSFPFSIVVGPDLKIAHVQKGYREGEGSTRAMLKTVEKLMKKM